MPHRVTKFVYETFGVRFVSVGGLRPRRGFAPDPRPVPPTTRMPAIIKVTQAANFHVLIG